MNNIIYPEWTTHRDPDICQVHNKLFSPYQEHLQGNRVGLFAGHNDINRELERVHKKYKSPQPEGI